MPPPDTEEFSTVMLTGHGLSEDQLTKAVPLHVPMAAVEGATLYLATVGGRPAAAAALFVDHGMSDGADRAPAAGCSSGRLLPRVRSRNVGQREPPKPGQGRLPDRVHESGLALRRVGSHPGWRR